ncbi:hypothetical protein ACQP1V_42915 (plasmid) [Microtetraspora malaysiensis]|uniref:hypothetical protein n=1 Tax=Microtetraspora malaysiensis TaxID=161358 RepID=UPI003D8A869D
MNIVITLGDDDIRQGSYATAYVTHVAGANTLSKSVSLNNGANWPNYSVHLETLLIDIDNPPKLSDLRSFSIKYKGGGGISGDNWKMNGLLVTYGLDSGEEAVLIKEFGDPYFIFTGDAPSWEFDFTNMNM